jgi:two-component system OmpR family response regulator
MRILLVEDDPDLSRQLKQALADAGYALDYAADGEEAQFLGETEPYDAVILDLGLPKVDGVSVLERWRRAGVTAPVLILTARGAWSEKVTGFDAGADDYLTKPFHTEELLARLRALVRRATGHASPTLSVGGLRLDPRAARASVNGEPLRLTSLEYRLLHYMMMHNGRVISRTELVEHLYDQDFDRDSNTIEVFVGRVRKKIGSDRIETVRGLGYRLLPLQGSPPSSTTRRSAASTTICSTWPTASMPRRRWMLAARSARPPLSISAPSAPIPANTGRSPIFRAVPGPAPSPAPDRFGTPC